jgi:hypothetical protein
VVRATFQQNLNDDNKGLLSSRWDSEIGGTVYIGDVINIAMNDWIAESF